MAERAFEEALLASTSDAFKSSRLEQMLHNLTASYKLYWLMGVIEEALEGHAYVSFEKLAARMVASAWYPVSYYRLNLGATDMLADAVLAAQETCALAADSDANSIIATVMESKDARLRSKMRGLYRYVPYRLIRPFYSGRIDEMREGAGRNSDSAANSLILRFNREDAAGAPYRFADDGSGIEIDHSWMRYFSENQHVVRGWLDSKLVSYLQARNPSVPAISLKISAPCARDLTAARKYWEEALADHTFNDIYSGIPFDAAGYAAYGPMGVDHFIPWSFVLHDEPWNLAPMFRDANSSKGNRLPLINEFLSPFCAQQFDALLTLRDTGRHKKVLESYHLIDAHVMDYERTDASLESFTEAVSKVVMPLYQIASNQGFPIWMPDKTHAYALIRY